MVKSFEITKTLFYMGEHLYNFQMKTSIKKDKNNTF